MILSATLLSLVVFTASTQPSNLVEPDILEQDSLLPETDNSEKPAPIDREAGVELAQAVRMGQYPAQLIGSTGAAPTHYGPQRNDPIEDIPTHAYSPFAEQANREYPCPPGGCEFMAGQVLVKLAADVQIKKTGSATVTINDEGLNQALVNQGILRLEPVFPHALPPKPGEFVINLQGERVLLPDLTRWQRAVIPETNDVMGTVELLAEVPGIVWAEPDYLRQPVGEFTSMQAANGQVSSSTLNIPSPSTDPLYGQQWHLDAVNAPAAWQWLEDEGFEPGGARDIVVAVIDTGVDYNHLDLAPNMWVNPPEFGGVPGVDDDGNGYVDDIYGADTVYPDGDPIDDHGHGTHVAGILAASAGNNEGGVGVAYNVQIMALKAAQYSGVLAASDIAEAIYYAVEKGADVLNMSFGGYARSQVEEDALAVAFGQAVLVAAAGNDGKVNLPCPYGRDMYPAAYNWVLGVMASTSSGEKAGFSNFDCIPHDSHEYELLAPGVDVWSTLPDDQYAAWDGTSMSTPIVSGIAALLRTRWSDKNVYSSRFIMGQIASNSNPVADAYTALTVAPQPELSYLELWLFDTEDQSLSNDDDGIVDAGEVIDLAIVIRNHWGKADPVTVTLQAWAEGAVYPDPYVTMISDTVSYGAVGSFNVDDNGMIYDDEGVITGVQHPFRFTVPITTPNDHVIPFLLTMEAGNGYDPNDPNTPYVYESRFYLIVQRGTELPTIISEDMTLTKDYYWIVPDQTLIESGITVTVTEGTQIQWGAPDPSDPYGQGSNAYIQVEGTILARGTVTEPVEFFPSEISQNGWGLVNIQTNGGTTDLSYVMIRNPKVGTGTYNQASIIDHAYFNGNTSGSISSQYLMNSIVHKIPTMEHDIQSHHIWTSLLDSPNYQYGLSLGNYGTETIKDTVFLQGNQNDSATHLTLRSAYYSEQEAVENAPHVRNAFLSRYWDPDINHWMRISPYYSYGRDRYLGIVNNFWGTTSTVLIDAAIDDFNDDFNRAHVVYEPFLTTPVTTTFPFVVDVSLSTANYSGMSALNGPIPLVGAEPVTFTVSFNRDMTTTIQPAVSFGPDMPETDYTIHPLDGGWQNARTWVGTFNITPITGDGYQLMRIAGAVANNDPWLVTGDDVERFRFEIITSGTESMNLQATGGEGYVDLMWTQNDFEMLAGFNLYKSTSQNGIYTRLNDSIIPPDQHGYLDTDVQPGQPYYYYFTVIKTDMSESDTSNIATATPVDTIPPVISHTPITNASPGLPLTLFADVTDNVSVQDVTLYYRRIGDSMYIVEPMVHTTGNRYAATIPGSKVVSPGLEYYIEAGDGISTVQNGRPEYPHQVSVVDQPIVTSVTPAVGPTSGGTTVNIAGSNFKVGATVTFGNAVATNVTVLSSSHITCTTPSHFPETVDVVVTNPDGQSGTLLQGYTYASETASLSLPDTGGGQGTVVQIPINANVNGLVAASLTVTFDENVIAGLSASAGNLTPGWSLATNTATPGEIRISMISPGGPVSGSGILSYLEFDVVGSPGMTTTLELTNVLLNDGAIPVNKDAGSFSVDIVYDVSGSIHFWNGGVVSGTLLTLAGDRVYTGLSGGDGTYTISGAATDDYMLTPNKVNEADGITGYDVSLALQHDAGLITLEGYAAIAADVNKSGTISSMDAYYIMQKAVELLTLPFPGAGTVWEFAPQNRSISNLNSNLTGQDFTALLIGDISGNWSPPLALQGNLAARDLAVVRVQGAPAIPDGIATAVITLDPIDTQAYSLDMVLSYNETQATPLSVDLGPAASGWLLATNLNQPGEVRMTLAGSLPIIESGEILTLRFVLSDPTQSTPLDFTFGIIDEGAVPVQLVGGQLGESYRIYIPLIQK